MNIFQDIVSRFSQTVTAYAGDTVLMQAMVSAAANVMVADGEIASAEFDTALAGLQANPILEKGYDRLMLESELYDGIARARTRAGRAENLRRVAAIEGRGQEEREATFLIAADVADLDGIAVAAGPGDAPISSSANDAGPGPATAERSVPSRRSISWSL